MNPVEKEISAALAQFRILGIDDGPLAIRVTAQLWQDPGACPHCQSTSLYLWDSRDQVFFDLPVHGKQVEIHINTKRRRCKDCEKTFFPVLPGMAEHRLMTERLARWIGQEGQVRTFVSIAEEVGVVEGTVRNVFGDYIEAMENAVRIQTPQFMGLEVVQAINKPRMLVFNVQARTVVDILAGRNKLALAKYLGRLPNPECVQFVGLGFSKVVLREQVLASLPSATVFIDKGHVLALARAGMERVCTSLRAELSPRPRAEQVRKRAVLMAREYELETPERALLAEWLGRYPLLGEAYRAKEAVHAVYESLPTHQEAAERMADVMADKIEIVRAHFSDLAQVLDHSSPYVLNYFKPGAGSASMECLGDVQAIGGDIDRIGRGYSFEASRAKVLFPEAIPAKPVCTLGAQLPF